MFPADTADFYQIVFHLKQIIRSSESQPYIKKQEKSSDIVSLLCSKSIDSIDTKCFLILATTNSESELSLNC